MFGAVNGVVSKLGGYCHGDDVWMKIVETQLFPILAFGSLCGLLNTQSSEEW